MIDKSIKIGTFILRKDAILEFDDGSLIDLNKADVTNVGIMYDGVWTVTLLTKAAIYRLQTKAKDSLELIGFNFESYSEAIFAHNLICQEIFKVHEKKE